MTRAEAKNLAKKVSVADLKFMFVNAHSKIRDWQKQSRVNKGMTIGTTFNVLSKCGIDENTHILAKINMVREFGEYLPDYEPPIKKTKNNLSLHHEDPNILDKSFYEF